MKGEDKMDRKEVVLITGGTSGIGKGIMEELIKRQYNVVITSRSDKVLSQLKSSASLCENERLMTMRCDVSKEEDVINLFEWIKEKGYYLDVLITSAGVSKSKDSDRVIPYSINELPRSEWDAILDVNLKGVFLTNKNALKIMNAQGEGQIINIGSAISKHGMKGQPYAPAYCASKFAVVGLSEAIAKEVEGNGITVQTICPGLVKTPLTENTALAALFDGKYMSVESFAKSIADMIDINKYIKTINPTLLPN